MEFETVTINDTSITQLTSNGYEDTWETTLSPPCQGLHDRRYDETGNLNALDTSDYIYAVYYATGIFSISIICLLGNFFIIHALLTSEVLKGVHNWFVLSLALSDILQGFTIPFYTMGHSVRLEIFKELDNWINCVILVYFVCVPQTISALNLVGITFVRYIAIQRPFDYKEFLENKKVIVGIAIAGCWVFGLLLSLFLYVRAEEPDKYCHDLVGSCRTEMIYDWWNIVVFAQINVVLPVCVMFTIYIMGMRSLNKQRKHLQSFSDNVKTATDNNHRMAKIVAFLLGYYTITWTPFIIYEGVYLACNDCNDVRYVRATTRMLYFSNVAVNVFVYTGRVQAFRNQFKKDLNKCRKFWCCCCLPTCCKCCKCCNWCCNKCCLLPVYNDNKRLASKRTNKNLSRTNCYRNQRVSSISKNEPSTVIPNPCAIGNGVARERRPSVAGSDYTMASSVSCSTISEFSKM